MRNQLVKPLVALFLSTASIEASAGLVSFTSTEFQQTLDGQVFTFSIDNAPLADLVAGSFTVHARGDYSINASTANPENIAVTFESVISNLKFAPIAPPVNSSSVFVDANNYSTVTNADLVEWSRSTLLPGALLQSWTQDNKILITLALSPDVTADLNAGQGSNPFVQATITYTTSAVPLPAATWLFLSGLIGMVGYGKQRKAD